MNNKEVSNYRVPHAKEPRVHFSSLMKKPDF
ncbi:hypothetical protein SAMN05443428_10286 [Caloramator quimbayensis]|uniref:Uncharacterized protein n=1 Tax=Caloramator quimbayensis TaxID=1147123 RepID=A0A1T4WKV3_9CLOT|nr:hypothetical protein SAMN05443428_10286 [Caloramator quimbayensis]